LLIILNLDVVGHYENTIGNPQTPPDLPEEAAQPPLSANVGGGPPQTAAGGPLMAVITKCAQMRRQTVLVGANMY